MTLTLPVLNAAKRVLFLVEGSAKAEILRTVLESNVEPPLPAQLVAPVDGQRWFLLDQAAAALLSRQPIATDPKEPGSSGQTEHTGEEW
jgi:6-phosphogluconolactonase